MVGTTGRSGGNRDLATSDLSRDDGKPACPPTLPQEVRTKWNEIVSQVPDGVLRQIDGHQIRLLAELLCGADILAEQVRSDPLNDKARRLFLQTCDRVNRLSGQFGLSPSDRRRLKIEHHEPNEFDDYMSRFD